MKIIVHTSNVSLAQIELEFSDDFLKISIQIFAQKIQAFSNFCFKKIAEISDDMDWTQHIKIKDGLWPKLFKQSDFYEQPCSMKTVI